jgi:hypothetical protein
MRVDGLLCGFRTFVIRSQTAIKAATSAAT